MSEMGEMAADTAACTHYHPTSFDLHACSGSVSVARQHCPRSPACSTHPAASVLLSVLQGLKMVRRQQPGQNQQEKFMA